MHLTLENVSYSYRRRSPILTDANLCADDRATLALVGPSGSGKTTILSLIGGFLRPDSGSIQLTAGCEAVRVNWIFQTVNTLGRRTVLDNVALGGYRSGMSRADALSSATSMIDAVGLNGMYDRQPRSLSGGELQRTVIARAMVGLPDLILADEPTGQLDAKNTDSVITALFNARPPTCLVVIATHDLSVAQRCDRRVSIVDNQIQELP